MNELNDIIRTSLSNLEVEILGYLEHNDERTFAFSTKLKDYAVTGALHVELVESQKIFKLSVKFAVCSDDDRYKKELGVDIALGRVLRVNQAQCISAGGISQVEVIKTFVRGKLEGLSKVLQLKRSGEKEIEKAEQNFYSNLSDEMEEYV